MTITNQTFSYLIKIQIGPHSYSMLVVNKREVPDKILETMAKEKIGQKINQLYDKHKDFRLQSSDQYFSKMIRQSDFEVENLNDIDIYDLNLKFENENIKNEIDENKESEVIQSNWSDGSVSDT